MPSYEYRCKSCEYHFEIEQKITENPLLECPKCHKPNLRRVIGNVGVAFKGSGFHLTDYKKPMQPEKTEKPAPKK